MASTTIEQVREYFQNEYDRITGDWYANDPSFLPASISVELGVTAGCYSFKENKMMLFVGEHNLEDFERVFKGEQWSGSKLGWFANQSEFIHELLHEFQHKGIEHVTEVGRALFIKYRHRHPDPGHGDVWFTAIAEKAPYFRVTPDELYLEL